ncbi:MAG: transcription-repair coupling factor [Chloroflexi bacterium]|nr:transcription-repair coupling factor [Chloroflexota bacterium]
MLDKVPAYREAVSKLGTGVAQTATLPEAAKPFVLAALAKRASGPVVIICPHPDDSRRMAELIQAYAGDDAPIFHFAESEVLPYERLSVEAGTVHERLAALGALHGYIDDDAAQPPIIVTSVTGLMQKTISPELMRSTTHVFRADDKISIDETLLKWVGMGYTVGALVEEPGSAARRGDIVDIHGPGHRYPVRIDLWGNRIDTVRIFESASQRSTDHIPALRVLPAAELLPSHADHASVEAAVRGLDYTNTTTAERDRVDEDLAELLSGVSADAGALYTGFLLHHTLLDHLPFAKDAVLVVSEPFEVLEAARRVEAGAEKLRLAKQERGELPLGFPSCLVPWEDLETSIASWNSRLDLTRYHRGDKDDGVAIVLPFGPPASYQGELESLATDLEGRRTPTVITTQHSRRLEEVLRDQGIAARETRSLDVAPQEDVVHIVHGTLAGGWSLHERSEDDAALLTLLSDNEVFGTAKRRVTRPRRHSTRFRATTVEELNPGQYVVHVDHGIGRFMGTINRGGAEAGDGDGSADAEKGANREYLVLEYAEGDRLYVPMEHLDRISPYVGGDEASPSPTRLGTQEWTRAVSKARESTQKLAIDLLALYAKREMAQGYAHSLDTPWQQEMEDAFPFVETPDQEVAINDVKEDLENIKPMDRLVCGDVGYGKTEVALRAAFKAVMSGKQVALLVPTTVLAQQHYITLSERLEPYPITVEMLSRFRTPKEADAIIARLASGDVDIVVGTHRLVQKDVSFKDLGLVIIDEEHRFGVGHKERMKEMRQEVDVLTLTATPIPRTLHMALAGIRDISTIETPPEERLPIKTYLAEMSDDLIREAILRELDREGQVYYLHNRVQDIDLTADKIRTLVPEARVIVGHGQMHEDDLSQVMERFSDGEADVLVCTTIIESGLDIPAANTMIVERAGNFGLAQLYQLRGRIGRSSQRAYAYLLVERGRRLTDQAQRRLQTIVAATELGAGFRIAMKDLEIRGAGNILGAEQSGHIHAVGFDLYTRLLSQAVSELRAATGDGPALEPEVGDPVIDLGLPASIPEDLVPHMPTRMAMYQRLAKAQTLEEIDELPREFEERFGHQLPDAVHHLIYGVRVKLFAKEARVASIVRRSDHVTLRLIDQVGGARIPLERALRHRTSVGNQQIHMPVAGGDVPWGQALLEVLALLSEFQQRVPEMAKQGIRG